MSFKYDSENSRIIHVNDEGQTAGRIVRQVELTAECIEEVAEAVVKKMARSEQKTGKWEIYVISMFDGEGCRCSECGFEGVPYWDYCPNCGCRMREGEEHGQEGHND